MQNVNEKKKVIHFVITDGFSGSESVAANIIKDLPKDWEGYYVAPEGIGCETARKMELCVIPCDTSDIKAIKKVVREIKPFAIHAHDCRMSFNCARAGFDFIAHLHANWDWMKKLCPKSVLLAYTCKKASSVICVSDSIKDSFVFSSVMKGKAQVIGNTVDACQVLDMSRDDVGERYDICFVGRLVSEKRPLLFVELVKELKESYPEIKAVMIGDGELRGETEKRIEELSLQDNIHLKGFDPNPYKYMNSSRVGVLTSSVEGFGLVAVEMMILGIPVVAFPVGGLCDIVKNENGLLANDIYEMKDEILRLLKDDEYYSKKSKYAKSRSALFTGRKEYVNSIIKTYEHR